MKYHPHSDSHRFFAMWLLAFVLGLSAFLAVAVRWVSISYEVDALVGISGLILATISVVVINKFARRMNSQVPPSDVSGAPEGGRRPSGSYLPGTDRRV